MFDKTSINPNLSFSIDPSLVGQKENMGSTNLQYTIHQITEDETSKFTAMVKEMIANCKKEDGEIGK